MKLSTGNPFYRERTLIPPTLAKLVPSAVCDLDATKAASYPGSGQSWKNLVTTPADGSTQSAYDFALGATTSASTDDPTFTGSAGSPAAYFLLDGGDFFRIGANTTFLKAMHKTTGGTAWWIATAFNASNVVNQAYFTTNTATTALGLRLGISATSNLFLNQRGDTNNGVSTATGTLATSNNYLIVVSYDPVTAKRRFWVNTRTKSEAALTFNATSTDPTLAATIGSVAANGTRFYAFSCGNAFIDDADAAKIFTFYNTRHGRIYA